MAALSDYAENLVLNWLMTTGSATRPTAWYVSLHTGSPNDADDGANEISGNGYSRQALTVDAASGTGGTTSNNANVTFTASGGSWGTISHIGIYDASSGGNLLWHGSMTASKTIADGDTLQFNTGNIDLTIA
jgi:hypothetical protein